MDDVELIKQKISIVDFISEYLPLKKAGINFKANCPFHQEGTPSFMVSPERGIWHCFGCNKGGDAFKFLMEKENLTFPEALEILAQKTGIVLKKTKSEGPNPTDRLYEVNQKAEQFYQYLLIQHDLGKRALDYLKKRGLTDKTIEEFGIGYAPQNWDSLSKFLKKRSFKTEELISSGLCVASKSGCYDRFRGRIIFPLIDVRNRVMGFSGRILDSGEPKYINSPQTATFDKSKFLFGIHLCKGDIRQKKEAILVEGEMDMILSYQGGVKNVVATKGTALTEGQIDLLKKYTDTLSICFDTDLAGDAAARRGIEMADKLGMNIKVISFKDAKDPAELCLKDPKLWEKAVEEATPIYDYYIDSASKRFDPKLAASKKEIMAELLPIWRKITDSIVRDHYIQKLAALLQVKDSVINTEMAKINLNPKAPIVKPAINNVSNKIAEEKKDTLPLNRRQLLEEYVVALILHIPSDHTFIPKFPETLFVQEELKQIYVLLVLFLDSISFKGRAFKITEFVKTIPEDLIEVVDRLYLMQIDDKLNESAVWQKEVDLVVSELKKMLIKSSLEKLSFQIKSAQEFDNMDTLTVLNKKFRDLSVKLKNL